MLIKKQDYKRALEKIKDVEKYLSRAEHRREISDMEVQIYQNLGEFNQAYIKLQKLKKLVEAEKLTHYDMSGYTLWEQDLLYAIGYDPYIKKQLPELSDENKLLTSLPMILIVDQNHPNPFNPDTRIRFTLPEADHVRVLVYDIQGRVVTTLLDGRKAAGNHTAIWNGLNSAGQAVASGTYFCRVVYRDQVVTKKMLLVR